MSEPYRRVSRDDDEESPLRFDDRRAGRRRGGTPAPVTLIVSLLLLAGVAGGVFYLYRGGARGSNDAPQPVGAPIRDVRTAAPAQAQAADPAAGLSIYKDDPNASVPPVFVPPAEQPVVRQAPLPESNPAQTAVSKAASATAAAGADKSAPPPEAIRLPPKAKSTAAGPSSVDDLLAAAPQVHPSKPQAATSTPTANGAGAVVQIGAFSSERLADQAWNGAAEVAPGAMAGKGKHVTAMEKDGVTLYRTAITGFASRDAATALCAKLQASGKSCFVR